MVPPCLQVDVDSTSGSSQAVVKNTRSLSGGERSYTTVCFIMSLWEAMESPFRCMDEFDVFMVGEGRGSVGEGAWLCCG